MYRELRPAEVQQLRADAGLAPAEALHVSREGAQPKEGVRIGHAPTLKHITRTRGGKPRPKKITLREASRQRTTKPKTRKR
jgi:hypothetical protein